MVVVVGRCRSLMFSAVGSVLSCLSVSPVSGCEVFYFVDFRDCRVYVAVARVVVGQVVCCCAQFDCSLHVLPAGGSLGICYLW